MFHCSYHPGDGQRALKDKDKTLEQKLSAGLNGYSFVQSIFFLPLGPKNFKVTTDQHEASS